MVHIFSSPPCITLPHDALTSSYTPGRMHCGYDHRCLYLTHGVTMTLGLRMTTLFFPLIRVRSSAVFSPEDEKYFALDETI